MNIDRITPSVLHVSASEDLNIGKDLLSEQTKTIAELLKKDKYETKENAQITENPEETPEENS